MELRENGIFLSPQRGNKQKNKRGERENTRGGRKLLELQNEIMLCLTLKNNDERKEGGCTI